MCAVGGFIRSVHTVVVTVTHPHSWDAAFGDGALELVWSTSHLRTVLLVLPVATIVLPVAAEDARDAAIGVGAFELTGQADVHFTVGLIRVILTVIVSITDEGWVGADSC